MQSAKRKIHIDWEGNPELQAAFLGKKAGESCEASVKFLVEEVTENGLVGTIEEVSPEGYEPPAPKAEPTTEDASPAMMIMAGKSRKSK